ncbi:P-type DNA transfer ATPase VirB11 [Methylomonas sp. MO1]|uniref:P-type DNA transfer ATPase VirB11 n=1 Tax=Methylomonas sp. MO1 TaxID=3073619 RepID=UPI0028A419FA|nr:P-type DNA transfer ATPase VirB11 [Methylomonas sp. MO1]MDT4292360.1 P-type DNA transfer ATPase VirB11 [Methylomonas sp. MO1]
MEMAQKRDNVEYLSALHHYLTPLRYILDDDNVTEVCINQPFEAYIQRYGGKACEKLTFATPGWCRNMANLVANKTAQGADEATPLLSADLPTGERIQFVLPPAAEHVSITIRRPSKTVWSLDELAGKGLFSACKDASDQLDEVERELLELKDQRRYVEFIKLGIRAKKNFLLSGVTGSGKTTANKALILEIPAHERIITIEDAKELVILNQPDHVRLFYSKGGQGQSNVTPKMLLEACLRMKPDRLFLAELRSDEAFEYLRAVASHPGSITSVHGHTAQLALAQMVLLLRQSPAGQALQAEEIKSLLYQTIDIVLQFDSENEVRFIKEIWYRPELKRVHGL